MFRGVVFDLDHTLFDRYETIRKTLHVFYNKYRDKIPPSIDQGGFIERFIEIEKKYIHHDWHRILTECAKNNIITPLDEDEIEEVKQFIFKNCWSLSAVSFPFAIPTLKQLSKMGYKLGLITNGPHSVQMKKLQMLCLDNSFDEIIITGDIGVHKPDPLPFKLMSQRLNIKPGELIYVGDHPLNDVEASRKAGYTPIWINATGYWSFPDIPRAPYELDTVDQLPELLEQINK